MSGAVDESAVGFRPDAWISGCADAHRRLEAALDGYAASGGTHAQPSRLDGWTIGHVLSHLARNADSLLGLARAAMDGEIGEQYPGGPAAREDGITEGAKRPLADAIAEVRASNARLESAWSDVPAAVWGTGLGRRILGLVSLADTTFLRWREAEVHCVDLGIAGFGWDAMPEAYVSAEYERTVAGLAARLPSGVVVVLAPEDRPSRVVGWGDDIVVVQDTHRNMLPWLTGRADRDATGRTLPLLGPWF